MKNIFRFLDKLNASQGWKLAQLVKLSSNPFSLQTQMFSLLEKFM